MAETLEVTIAAKNKHCWSVLTDWLEFHELPYVSGCVVEGSSSDEELEAWVESSSWDQLSDWPVSLYFDQEAALVQFVESLWGWLESHGTRQWFHVQVQKIPNQIWQEAWEAKLASFESKFFAIQIAGESELESDKPRITIDPGNAFGSGQHATTKASLMMLENLSVDDSLLDVGTGTGILAIAALKLGYQRVVGTDIDADSWFSCERNQRLNRSPFLLLHDSLPDIGEVFDVIICNILPPVVVQLMPELVARLKTAESQLVLSGIHQANKDLVMGAAHDLRLRLTAEVDERGWVAMCFKRA
ncbi:MAG: 50S ribosomal protein L11 methyltransferase [Oligoflexus sp.]